MKMICRAVLWFLFVGMSILCAMSLCATFALSVLFLTTLYSGFSLVYITGLKDLINTTFMILLNISIPLSLSLFINWALYGVAKYIYKILTKTFAQQLETA